MSRDISKENLERSVDELKSSVTREECWSCECFQGFFAQLGLDFKKVLPCAELEGLKVEPDEMHSCLGCESCGPAEVYSRYLVADSESNSDDKEKK
ncbi:MAG: hypothetical protein V3V95_06235 [Thermodesulfobacteriota bacterium]